MKHIRSLRKCDHFGKGMGKFLLIRLSALSPLLLLAFNYEILQRSRSLERDHGTNAHETAPFYFSSGALDYDDGYKLAMSEVEANIDSRGRFIAGAGWTQLWTRDTSYAVELALGFLQPKVAKQSLLACTEKDPVTGNVVWLQDRCGHFGGWPNLSDAIVGAQGAWAYYVISGDTEFLNGAYNITKNSLLRAERDALDNTTGLFLGCSSFMESNSGYPSKYSMNGDLVGKTKALSTNLLHYNGYKLGAMMGKALGAPSEETDTMDEKANRLRDEIRSRLWLPDKGYYSYFEDENDKLVSHMEGLGESLVLLAPGFEDDVERIDKIFSNTPKTSHGIPCLWPRFDIKENARDIASYYHNGRIWPFVQGYWGMAAAMHGKVNTFADEFSKIIQLSQIENTFAEFYELNGDFPKERHRQLWSDAGFLSFVYHGLFGINFFPNGIEFKPVKPPKLPFHDTIKLLNVKYREMTLDIFVTGSGSDLRVFTFDGRPQKPFVPCNLTGLHKVDIIVGDNTKGAPTR